MITAQFPGECTSCGYDITPGEQIEPDDAGGWQHAVCPDEGPETAAVSCPHCFTIHAGECL